MLLHYLVKERQGGAIVITTKKRGPKQGIGLKFTQSVMQIMYMYFQNIKIFMLVVVLVHLHNIHYAPGQPAEWQALNGKYLPGLY